MITNDVTKFDEVDDILSNCNYCVNDFVSTKIGGSADNHHNHLGKENIEDSISAKLI